MSCSNNSVRYSTLRISCLPSQVVIFLLVRITGNPEKRDVSTSYVERANLTMGMAMRRFTRLTNAFSKKLENLTAAVSLHFFHYNFCRVHKTLKTTPAVASGITDHVWPLSELIGLLEQAENVSTRRGSYQPRRRATDSK